MKVGVHACEVVRWGGAMAVTFEFEGCPCLEPRRPRTNLIGPIVKDGHGRDHTVGFALHCGHCDSHVLIQIRKQLVK